MSLDAAAMADNQRLTLCQKLADNGWIRHHSWRIAFENVPRHAFIPHRVWLPDRDGKGLIAADLDDEAWINLAYRDEPVVVQADDIEEPEAGMTARTATSVLAAPSVVAVLLEELDVAPGMHVLEIGSGCGYATALLADRLGPEAVTAVERSPVLADRARAVLETQEYRATVITGDASHGHPPAAPFERVLSHCAVARVPYSWVEQTRPGRAILTPIATPFVNLGVVPLVVGRDGTAEGRFLPWEVSFPPLQLPTTQTPSRDSLFEDSDIGRGTADVHPAEVLATPMASFVSGLAVARCAVSVERDADGIVVMLVEEDPPMACSVYAEHAAKDAAHGDVTVVYAGPTPLWLGVERSYRWWLDAGRPGIEEFGLTVTPDRQWVWHQHPESNATWEL